MLIRRVPYRLLFNSGFILLLLLCPGKNIAQTREIDSLQRGLNLLREDSTKVNTLLALSTRYRANNDTSNTIRYAKESLGLAKRINYKKGEGDAFFDLGIIYREIYNLAEAKENLLEATRIREEMNDDRVAFCYMAIARIYVIENNYPESIKSVLQALGHYEKKGDKAGMAQAYSRLGFNYKAYGNYQESDKYYSHSLELFKETNRKERVADNLCEIGLLKLETGNDSLALLHTLDALKISQEIKYDQGIANASLCLGNIYLVQSEKELAEKNYSSANKILLLAEKKCLLSLAYFENTGDNFFNYGPFSRASVYHVLGNIYIGLKKFTKARNYLEKGNRLTLASRNRSEVLESYLSLYRLDSLEGNFDKALINYKKYILYRDSIANADNSARMETAEMQYAFSKKEDSLKQKQLITEVKLQTQQKQKYFYLVGLILLGLLSFLGYKNFRNQKKINRIADETHAREKAELELHSLRAQLNPHFMFNSLNAIQELILMEENEKSQSYLARFAKLLRMLLENAERPFIPLQREIDFLKLYLSLENLRIPDLQHNIIVDSTIDTEKTIIPNMILQPYIENAIWHGLSHKTGDRKLSIQVNRQNGVVEYAIEDNGVGRIKSAELKSLYRKEHKSKGMELLSKRFKLLAKEYGSDIEATYADVMDKGEVAGTRVTIKVPKEFSGELYKTD